MSEIAKRMKSLFDVLPAENRKPAGTDIVEIDGEQFRRDIVPNRKLLIVEFKSQFGLLTIRPVNSVAREFASLARTKTLLVSTLRSAEKLGFLIGEKISPNVCRKVTSDQINSREDLRR